MCSHVATCMQQCEMYSVYVVSMHIQRHNIVPANFACRYDMQMNAHLFDGLFDSDYTVQDLSPIGFPIYAFKQGDLTYTNKSSI